MHFRASIGRGVDVRYRGGVVVAPSVHPETRRQYTWTPDHHPLNTLIAEPPAWLIDLLTPDVEPSPVGQARPVNEEDCGWGPKPRYSRAALQRACERIETAPVGQQDQTLNREAYSIGRLVGGGMMPRRLARDCLIFAAQQMTNAPHRRPWRRSDIENKVERALTSGSRQPRDVLP